MRKYAYPQFAFNMMKFTLFLMCFTAASAFSISITDDDKPKTEGKFAKIEKLQDALAELLEDDTRHHCHSKDWIQCATLLLKCNGACCAGSCLVSTACVGCLGGLYERCKKCF